jgi:hypothetical protein
MGGNRFNVWVCSVGDHLTNKTVLNRTVNSEHILQWVMEELNKLDTSIKTVVVRIDGLGISDCTAIHVFERKKTKIVQVGSDWVEYNDAAIRLMISDYSIHISADGGIGVQLPVTCVDVTVVRALIDSGTKLTLVAPWIMHPIEVKEENIFLHSLNF